MKKAGENEVADRREVLRLLTAAARKGSVSAMRGLAEELRREEGDGAASEFDALDNVTPLRRSV